MGRRENPVDHSRPARGRLAEYLRLQRQSAGMTYQELAWLTGLSPATLKRAASGAVVPKHTTVEAYVEGCGGGPGAVRDADELWRHARIEERGRLAQLHAPRPELISDAADLSRALEVVWEQAGAPSLRDIRDRSGNPLALPVSSAARIVNRDAIPADEQQLKAFLTGCGIPPEKHTAWTAAFAKAISTSAAAAAQELPPEWTAPARQVALRRLSAPERKAAWRRLLRTASAPTSRSAQPGAEASDQMWGRLIELLPPAAHAEAIASLIQSHLASEATRNGKTLHTPASWQPDMLAVHDGKYTLIEFKSTSNPPGRPPADGTAGIPSHRPPGSGGHPTARTEPRPRPRHTLSAVS
ncbi:helix-turn-helix domain-containing protein [Streptomyces leeuwenhoekii]|uniref:helix-turn-helix domain-containing protein n=1 Tax=Streptomyces leeuwenhoekii TaxID=1437453 RepID=UPI0036C72D8F